MQIYKITGVSIVTLFAFLTCLSAQAPRQKLYETEISSIAKAIIPSIGQEDLSAITLYYSNLLHHVADTNISARFAAKYADAVCLEIARAVYNNHGYKSGCFTNLNNVIVANDARIRNLNIPILSVQDEAKLLSQIDEIAQLTHLHLVYLLSTKPRVRFISGVRFDLAFNAFRGASEYEMPPKFYHFPTNHAEANYTTNLSHIKSVVARMAIDYAAYDQCASHRYIATNLFYNGMLMPVPSAEFVLVTNRIKNVLTKIYSGDTFVVDVLSLQKVLSEPIRQLAPASLRPEISPSIFSETEGLVFDNYYYKHLEKGR